MAEKNQSLTEISRSLNSLTVASRMSEIIRQAHLEQMAAIQRVTEVTRQAQLAQFDAINKLTSQYSTALLTFKVPNIVLDLPTFDFARITSALQPSLALTKAMEEIRRPLALAQLDFLSNISTPKLDLSAIAGGLAQESRLIGEFDGTDDSETDIEVAEFEPVYERFSLVQLLPLRVLDAIAEQPELMRGLDPRDFEKLVAELLNSLGFENIILTPRSGDGGRDVLATKFTAGIPLLFSFECKRYANKIGLDIMRGLLGSVAHGPTKANKGVLVTISSFTSGASDFIVSEPLVDGKDFNDLVGWLSTYKDGQPIAG